MVVGHHPQSLLLLNVLKLNVNKIPRFRYVYRQGNTIIVLTRTGGNNRNDYFLDNATLQEHPQYIKDYDDTFDVTFAHFVFRIPEDMLDILVTIPDDPDPMDVFQAKIALMGEPKS